MADMTYMDCAVTHWMPLPELPKTDGGDSDAKAD